VFDPDIQDDLLFLTL